MKTSELKSYFLILLSFVCGMMAVAATSQFESRQRTANGSSMAAIQGQFENPADNIALLNSDSRLLGPGQVGYVGQFSLGKSPEN